MWWYYFRFAINITCFFTAKIQDVFRRHKVQAHDLQIAIHYNLQNNIVCPSALKFYRMLRYFPVQRTRDSILHSLSITHILTKTCLDRPVTFSSYINVRYNGLKYFERDPICGETDTSILDFC